MKLTRVTITGADDEVPQHALRDLSIDFPFVEWGVLLSRTRTGTPRYPSYDWLKTLSYRPDHVRISNHLCGQMARGAMGGARFDTLASSSLSRPVRCQLNGFSSYVLPELLIAAMYPNVEFILQCSTLEAIERATGWRVGYPNVSALWDCSCGKGVVMEQWPLPNGQLPIGYAGGITEDNIVGLLEKLTANYEKDEYWVDLETGARTDDKFDLAKVRRILELAKPFVGVHVGGR